MWADFAAAVLIAFALLYGPGYLAFRGMGFGAALSFCCAPLFGVFMYTLLPVPYYELGIVCSPLTVALPALALGGGAFLLGRRAGKRASISLPALEPVRVAGRQVDFDLAMLALCVALGVVVCAYTFVSALPQPDAFWPRFDNQTHLNLARSFLDSGKWSTLHTSKYLASDPASASWPTTGGYYPAGWHVLVALVCSTTGTPVTVGTNAAIALVCGITCPTCLYLLIRMLFRRNRIACAIAPAFVCSSAVMPWTFVIKGPTWPDMLANSLVPAALALMVILFEGELDSRRRKLVAGVLVCSLVSPALAHSNAVFTEYVAIAAYGAHFLWTTCGSEGRHPLPTSKRVAALVLYTGAVVALWVLSYQVPALQSILYYRWKQVHGIGSAIAGLGGMGFRMAQEQPVLMLGVALGTVACVRRKHMWLLLVPAFFGLCYFASMVGWEFVKYWLAAYWYMTPYRFATRIMTFTIPVIVYGYARAIEWARPWWQSHRRLAACVCVCAFLINYAPVSFYDPQTDSGFESAFGTMHRRIENVFSTEVEHVYSTEEIAFVQKVVDTIGTEALVINCPNDGSVWAYGANRLNTYYRSYRLNGITDDAVLIRKSLRDVATNQEVQDAVARSGASTCCC